MSTRCLLRCFLWLFDRFDFLRDWSTFFRGRSPLDDFDLKTEGVPLSSLSPLSRTVELSSAEGFFVVMSVPASHQYGLSKLTSS